MLFRFYHLVSILRKIFNNISLAPIWVIEDLKKKNQNYPFTKKLPMIGNLRTKYVLWFFFLFTCFEGNYDF